MRYRIVYKYCGQTTKEVRGHAFMLLGWPEFHCCVRFGRRNPWDIFDEWLVDHYETGYAVGGVGKIENKKDAPMAMKRYLDGLGKDYVHAAMRKAGIL